MGNPTQEDGGIQWDLADCCGHDVKVFLICYFVYMAFIYTFWKQDFLKPMKLLGVFVHEMGHASATWLTCGKVKKVEVYNNEGGITGYSGGIRTIVIPAGYVGGAFWGGAIVALSGNRIGATVAACIVAAALVIALALNPNKTVVYISIGFTVVTLVAIAVDWFVFDPFLQYFTLFYGVFLGYYACRDIWDDTVKNNTEGSDAYACNQLYPCCVPRWVGIQFLLLGLMFQVLGLYLAMVFLLST